MNVIYTTIGKTVDLTLHVYVDGYLTDAMTDPEVTAMYLPNMSINPDFPQIMEHIDTGIYIFSFTIPKSPNSIGNFIANIKYTSPNGNLLNKIYQIIVRRTDGRANGYFGVISASA